MSEDQLKEYFGDENIVNGSFHKAGGNAGNFQDDGKLRDYFTGEMGRSESDWDDDVSFEKDLNTLVSSLYNGEGSEADEGPYEMTEKSDRHKELENEYGEGAFPAMSSAVDSYNTAFDAATAAGRDMSAGDMLRQRADDKKSWITGKFMPYMSTKNELARHESHHAASNAIARAAHAGVEPPVLKNPMEDYDKFREDIENISA